MVSKQGLYVSMVDGEAVMTYDGKPVDKVLSNTRYPLGLYVNGGKLILNTSVIAESPSPAELLAGSDLYFDEVNLSENGQCVNITLENYNKLLNGQFVDGYKRFSPSTIYNIVSNVDSAETVNYTISNGKVIFSGDAFDMSDNMLYNNVSDELIENTVNGTANISNSACPVVNVKYFNPVIPVGGNVTLEYYVDNQTMSSLNYDELDDTFTVIVETSLGATVKKTTYAGRFTIETPAFNTAGEYWISVKCIDINGVESVTKYYDVLVKAAAQDNFYVMQSSDLATYGIVANLDQKDASLANKAALSRFFAAVKSGEIDGSSGYNGVKMVNAIYYVDYHAVNGYGTQTYYKCAVTSNKITAVETITEADVITLEAVTHLASSAPAVGDNCVTSDAYYYYVVNTSYAGDYIEFPDGFTVDLNGSSIRASQCNDLARGWIVYLNGNYDTHIINGKLVGVYNGFDFATTSRRVGSASPAEWLSVVGLEACKYCSLEKLDISNAVGYDGQMFAKNHWFGVEPEFTEDKRVDLSDGSVITAQNMMVTQMFDCNPSHSDGYLCFGRTGYMGYKNMGTRREYFVSFFDENKDYISSVKTKFYYLVPVPSSAAYAIISCYGKLLASGTSNDVDWKNERTSGSLVIMFPTLSIGIVYSNCHWHDTRTTALSPIAARSTLIYGCSYKNIAKEKEKINGGWSAVTALMGDIEDSWQLCHDLEVRDCSCVKGEGVDGFAVHFCNGFTMTGCSGMELSDRGGIEYGFVEGNDLVGMEIQRNHNCYHPAVVYSDNTIDTLLVRYGYSEGVSVVWGSIEAEKVVTMLNSTIKNQCLYEDLNLKNSINGVT